MLPYILDESEVILMSRGITQEQYEMIDLVLDGKTIAAISRILNKSRPTIYNWLTFEEIKNEIQFRKSERRKSAKDRISSQVDQSITNIVDIANNCTDPRVKLQANKYLVDQCLGVPGTTREETETKETNDIADINSLLAELDEIKKLKVIK